MVDRLLDLGFEKITVVDIADHALDIARRRLGARARRVNWVVADVRGLLLSRPVDLWHDRAVLHFLTHPDDQAAYVQRVEEAVKPGGHVLIATFGPEGPVKCSGLPVERYDTERLLRRLGPGFELVQSLQRTHTTPTGVDQQFTYGLFRRRT